MTCIKATGRAGKHNLVAAHRAANTPNRRIVMAHPHPHLHLQADQLYPFDARGIAMRFCNDHDPLPLLDQLRARYGDKVEISYVQREPGAIVIDFVKKQA
jgi:uncharacterized protein (DUF2249 family)